MRILDLALPAACGGCRRYGHVLCDRCRAAFRPAAADHAFLGPDAGVVVGGGLELAMAAFAHDGVLRRVLQRLKYGGAASLARPLAGAALPAFRRLQAVVPRTAPLVPVPVHRDRLLLRGYNQAELLAVELARQSGRRVAPILVRRRPTLRQHHLGRSERLRNLEAAFEARPGLRAPPVVLLVDDIVTTAATLEACAAALRRAGARQVYGFAIAREV